MLLIDGEAQVKKLELTVVAVKHVPARGALLASAADILPHAVEGGALLGIALRVIAIAVADVGLEGADPVNLVGGLERHREHGRLGHVDRESGQAGAWSSEVYGWRMCVCAPRAGTPKVPGGLGGRVLAVCLVRLLDGGWGRRPRYMRPWCSLALTGGCTGRRQRQVGEGSKPGLLRCRMLLYALWLCVYCRARIVVVGMSREMERSNGLGVVGSGVRMWRRPGRQMDSSRL